MTAGFSLRKIKSPVILGQKLKKARKKLKVDITEAELATKIRSKYLLALEADDFLSLPADAYTKGFVMRYAKFLGMDEDKALEEYLKHKSQYQDGDDILSPSKSYHEVKFIVTPKLFAPIGIAVIVISLFAYLAFQINGFAAAPELSVLTPNNNSVLDKENIEVKGTTSQQAAVYINDQQIQVASDGTFATDYKLLPGVNVIQIKSRNKADKEKSLTYTVEYKAGSARASVQPNNE